MPCSTDADRAPGSPPLVAGKLTSQKEGKHPGKHVSIVVGDWLEDGRLAVASGERMKASRRRSLMKTLTLILTLEALTLTDPDPQGSGLGPDP